MRYDKYCVVCADKDRNIRSLNIFESEDDANLFLAKEASRTYEKLLDMPNSSISVKPGYAKVIGTNVLEWKVHHVAVHQ